MRLLLAVATSTLLLLPAVAGAATVEVVGDVPAVRFVAAAGEVNLVTVTMAPDERSVTLADAGAPVTPGAGCAAVDANTVTCTGADDLTATSVALGDGDDAVTAASGAIVADGGPGSDTLRGGGDDDTLNGGGGGADTLIGGDGDATDELTDGDTDAAHDADVLAGGGEARVSYEGRADDVTIDLRGKAVSGADGEGDTITGVEDATGGDGDDRIVGTDTANELDGGAGDDVLIGGAGGRGPSISDSLTGGAGDDTLRGGAGPDALYPGAGRDRLSCGSSFDDVYPSGAGELVPADCEQVVFDQGGFAGWTLDAKPKAVRGERTSLGLSCPGVVGRCSGAVTVRGAGGVLARGAYRLRKAAFGDARLRLTPAGRRAAARRGSVRVTVRVTAGRRSARWTTVLR